MNITGNPSSADRIAEALKDPDARVRSNAAQALTRMRDARAAAACLQTLDDVPDELHADITPSVAALATMGVPVIEPLLELMLADSELTRLHAQRALEGIVDRMFGFVPGSGYPDTKATELIRSLWAANGSYDSSATEQQRHASVARWRVWLQGIMGKR